MLGESSKIATLLRPPKIGPLLRPLKIGPLLRPPPRNLPYHLPILLPLLPPFPSPRLACSAPPSFLGAHSQRRASRLTLQSALPVERPPRRQPSNNTPQPKTSSATITTLPVLSAPPTTMATSRTSIGSSPWRASQRLSAWESSRRPRTFLRPLLPLTPQDKW